jgi:predicted MarR family transcription regulator
MATGAAAKYERWKVIHAECVTCSMPRGIDTPGSLVLHSVKEANHTEAIRYQCMRAECRTLP